MVWELRCLLVKGLFCIVKYKTGCCTSSACHRMREHVDKLDYEKIKEIHDHLCHTQTPESLC